MAFNINSPQTELDNSRLTAPDYTTEQSIPSPSREGNSLLKQIKSMRQPSRLPVSETPRQRHPLLNRQNLPPAKNEFTPLLKSATKNRQHLHFGEKENVLQTPAGLRNSYGSKSRSSPALPLGSSILLEEHTGTSLEMDPSQDVPALPASSSSPMSTPMTAMHRHKDGVLDHGNVATLREQEQRLEQIDKENFGLKLKIHFLEEALKRSGKDFNEAALKENTDLKVDKLTLQRDLKHYRKQLVQAEKDLASYKQQLCNHGDDAVSKEAIKIQGEELEKLRKLLQEKEDLLAKLDRQLEEAENKQQPNEESEREIANLKDTITDLEQDLRDKDREMDKQDDEIELLKAQAGQDGDALEKLDELQETVDDLQARLANRDQELSERIAQVQVLKDQASQLSQAPGQVQSLQTIIAGLKTEVQDGIECIGKRDQEISQLKEAAKESANVKQGHLQSLQRLDHLEGEILSKDRLIQERDASIRKLKDSVTDLEADLRDAQRQLDSCEEVVEQLKDQLREKDRNVDDLQDAIENLKEQIRSGDEGVSEINHLRSQISSRADETQRAKDQVELLRQQIDEKDEDLKALEEALRQSGLETDAKLRQRERQIEQKDDELRELEEQLEAMGGSNSGHSHLDEDVRKRDDRIKGLKQEVVDLQAKLDDADYRVRQFEQTVGQKEDELESVQLKLQHLERETDDELMAAQDRIEELELAAQKQENLRKSIHDDETAKKLSSSREEVMNLKSKLETSLRDLEQIRRVSQDSVRRKEKELTDANTKIQELEDDVAFAREHEMQLQTQIQSLREQIQRLEKQVDAKQADSMVANLRQEVETLQGELHDTSQALGKKEQELVKVNKSLSASASQLSLARSQMQDLEDELDVVQQQAEEDVRKAQATAPDRQMRAELAKSTQEQSRLQAELDLLKQQADKDSRAAQLNSLDRQTGVELGQAKKEKRQLQDELDAMTLQNASLSRNNTDLEQAIAQLDRQLRESNTQVQKLQREFDRKLESQVSAYELDIRNLEQDLADAESKQKGLKMKQDAAEATIVRLRTRITDLEQDLAVAVHNRGAASPTTNERRDLHQMLKNAKVEAEDLALQLQDREHQLQRNADSEANLRNQLKRVREERDASSRRAASSVEELEKLRRAHEHLEERARDLRAITPAGSAGGPEVQALERRHVKELNGLAKQIEYLAARLRREERFRSDLQHTKHFFQQSVAMYAQCNKIDLKLVREMGVPVNELLRDEQERARLEGPGRVRLRSKKTEDGHVKFRSRPSLKVVALMVLAGVRMNREARKWSRVRDDHDGLVRKLKAMRKAKELETDGAGRGSLGKRKNAR